MHLPWEYYVNGPCQHDLFSHSFKPCNTRAYVFVPLITAVLRRPLVASVYSPRFTVVVCYGNVTWLMY